MKKFSKIIIALVLCLGMVLSQSSNVFADFMFDDNGFRYRELSNETRPGLLEASGYAYASMPTVPTELVIPDTITYNGIAYPVATVGLGNFSNSNVSKVTFGKNIDSIGFGAFQDNLITEVNIPHGVLIVWHLAFKNNQITTANIPSTTTRFGMNIFMNNKLKTIYLESIETLPLLTSTVLDKANSDTGIVEIYAPQVTGVYKDTELTMAKTTGQSITLSAEADYLIKQVERYDDVNNVFMGADPLATASPYTGSVPVQWYRDGNPIAGATSLTYTETLKTSGNYVYTVKIGDVTLENINVEVTGASITEEPTPVNPTQQNSNVTPVKNVPTGDNTNISLLLITLTITGVIIVSKRKREKVN